MYALQRVQETDTAAWNTAPILDDTPGLTPRKIAPMPYRLLEKRPAAQDKKSVCNREFQKDLAAKEEAGGRECMPRLVSGNGRIPELIGDAPCMLEVSRRIRLVAARTTPVLIEGPTGSGKELVAEALHALHAQPQAICRHQLRSDSGSPARGRALRPYAGAFTGAVQGRVGRIESADGGTLFLDEIGEMPLAPAVQAAALCRERRVATCR